MTKKITLVLVTLGLALASVGCSSSPAYTCQGGLMCGANAVQSCCTTTQCEYRAPGRTFPCNGTDCMAAAMQLAAYCASM